ncbi:dual specificity protein phosphatase 23 isoform X2 [Monodelphis domestica]|uniref:dual specificity protein phosphatase 23 isoform X2 n=1 Tax=Monodelphis domestica TaxID=13616 RepID=UPI0024E1E614|nr:dual specificity protein phosphatase 23 isoform X2 [Monodelphis domestica]
MGSQPPNFSWVLPGRLAGLALPRLPAHYQFLWAQGVRHLVSLTERGPPHSDTCPNLTVHRLRIPDFCPPTPEQINNFIRIVDDANARGEMLLPTSDNHSSGLSWSIHPTQPGKLGLEPAAFLYPRPLDQDTPFS